MGVAVSLPLIGTAFHKRKHQMIGVIFSSTVTGFESGKNLDLKLDLPTIIIACVVALVIIPQIHEKLNIAPGTPFLIRFGLFVTVKKCDDVKSIITLVKLGIRSNANMSRFSARHFVNFLFTL